MAWGTCWGSPGWSLEELNPDVPISVPVCWRNFGMGKHQEFLGRGWEPPHLVYDCEEGIQVEKSLVGHCQVWMAPSAVGVTSPLPTEVPEPNTVTAGLRLRTRASSAALLHCLVGVILFCIPLGNIRPEVWVWRNLPLVFGLCQDIRVLLWGTHTAGSLDPSQVYADHQSYLHELPPPPRKAAACPQTVAHAASLHAVILQGNSPFVTVQPAQIHRSVFDPVAQSVAAAVIWAKTFLPQVQSVLVDSTYSWDTGDCLMCEQGFPQPQLKWQLILAYLQVVGGNHVDI